MDIKRITESVNRIQFSDIGITNTNFDILWISATDRYNADTLTTHFHQHTFYEIHIITKGFILYGFKDKEINVSKGNLVIIPPGERHTVKEFSDVFSKFTIAFETDNTGDYYEMLSSMENILLSLTPVLSDEMQNIYDISSSKLDFKSELVYLSVARIIYVLCSLYGEKRRKLKSSGDETDDRITKAKKYITDNMDLFLTCEDVANHCHISSKQLGRLFREKEGTSLLDYIHNCKITLAISLLTGSDLTLQEISDKLGFSGVQYFCKFFKAKTDLTPSRYRDNIGHTAKNGHVN